MKDKALNLLRHTSFLQACQSFSAQFGIFATLKEAKKQTKNPEENVFSLYEFKFLFPVWTFQFCCNY